MRCERRLGHPTAPRGASMLELEKSETGAGCAVASNCSAASQQNVRSAQVADAAEWICHLDIVNLKQSACRALPVKERWAAPLSRLRSEPGRRPQSSRILPALRLRPPRGCCPRMESGNLPDGSTTRPGLSVQPAGHRLMVPAKRPAQPSSGSVAQTRSEFATHDK
jgi:hypothetical protein